MKFIIYLFMDYSDLVSTLTRAGYGAMLAPALEYDNGVPILISLLGQVGSGRGWRMLSSRGWRMLLRFHSDVNLSCALVL